MEDNNPHVKQNGTGCSRDNIPTQKTHYEIQGARNHSHVGIPYYLTKFPHIVPGLVQGQGKHTPHPPDLYLATVYKAKLVAQSWDTSVDSNMLTSYDNMASLFQFYHISSILLWEAAAKTLEQWDVLLSIILVPLDTHLDVYKLVVIIKATKHVSVSLQVKTQYQKCTPEDLIELTHTDFNRRICKISTSLLLVRCPNLAKLAKILALSHFCTISMLIPDGYC